jgi:hypothetical protein
MAMIAVGASDAHIYQWLSLINVAAFFGTIALLWTTAARVAGREYGALLALVALTSPLLYFAYSTLGEMLSTFLLVAVVAAAIGGRRAWWLAPLALMAGITKETAPPFVLALGAIGVFCPRPRPDWRRCLASLALGTFAAIVVNAGFNRFRFGVIQNRDYLSPQYHVHGIARKVDLFGALLFAPNGGIWWFWLSAMTVLTAGILYGVGRRRETTRRWPAVAVAALFLVLTAGLAEWWAPFGWFSWGPRLTLPWVPPLALLIVCAYGAAARPSLQRLLARPIVLAAVLLVLTVVTLPQIGVLFDPSAEASLFLPDAQCPTGMTSGSPTYYRCLDHQAWTRHMVLVAAIHGDTQPQGVLFSIALVGAEAGLLLYAVDRMPQRRWKRVCV